MVKMYRTRRMRNRRSGRSKRGGETSEKKAIKIALGITPETQIDAATHSTQRAELFEKLKDPEIMGEILNTWNSLLDDSVYDETTNPPQRKVGKDKLYVLSPRQQELASEFMGSSGLGRFFKTGHPDRKTFYSALITALRTPNYLKDLKQKLEDSTAQYTEIGEARRQYISAKANQANQDYAPAGVTGVEQPSMRKSAAAIRAAQNDQQEIHKTTDAAAGVSSAAVLPKYNYNRMGASAKVVEMKESPQQEFERKKAERAEKAAAAAEAAAEAERQRLAAEEAPIVAAAAPDQSDVFVAGKSRRRHRRSHRRSNKKSRKGRKTRKSHRRHKGGRR